MICTRTAAASTCRRTWQSPRSPRNFWPPDQAAIEFVLDGDAELRALERDIAAAEAADDGVRMGELHARYATVGGYDARSPRWTLMHGLGFATVDETRPVRAFSGGWRVRLNVAQALMCRSDLLLLDEPTNHLDPGCHFVA